MNAHVRTVKSSLIILTALALVAGCTDKASEAVPTPAVANTPSPAPTEVKPNDPWQGTESVKPIFPDHAASAEMKLDYESFQFEGNGLSVAPLPPFFGKAVEVKLTNPELTYTLKAGRPECSYKLKVTAGLGSAKLLDPKLGGSLQILPADFAGESTLTVLVALEDGAEQNWSCNIVFTPLG